MAFEFFGAHKKSSGIYFVFKCGKEKFRICAGNKRKSDKKIRFLFKFSPHERGTKFYFYFIYAICVLNDYLSKAHVAVVEVIEA